ncbi:hypothetical protein [Actinophytocola sp.]|uniref:hypothetical protein n=1 Tax=Actinophytocola sp. TaxID=1872138 RepID=UPI003D6ACC5E
MRAQAFPALGFDPAPGDTGAVTELAASYTKVGSLVADAQGLMGQAAAGAPGWTGTASDGYRAKAGELPAPLATTASAMRDAGAALDGWAADLGAMQVTADDLEAQARRARNRLEQANADAAEVNSAILPPDPRVREGVLEAIRRAVEAAQAELDAVRQAARRLLAQHAELAADLLRLLKSVYDKVFPNGLPELLEPEALRKIIKWALEQNEDLNEWVGDNAYAINEISNVVGDIATYFGAVGFVLELIGVTAPIGVGFSAASTVLTAGAFVGHTAAAVHGVREARRSAIEDAIGLGAAFAGGAATGRAARLAADIFGAASSGYSLRGAGEDVLNGLLGRDSHFQRYWVPRDWEEFRKGATIPGYQLYKAVERAYEIGHKKDLENR